MGHNLPADVLAETKRRVAEDNRPVELIKAERNYVKSLLREQPLVGYRVMLISPLDGGKHRVWLGDTTGRVTKFRVTPENLRSQRYYQQRMAKVLRCGVRHKPAPGMPWRAELALAIQRGRKLGEVMG